MSVHTMDKASLQRRALPATEVAAECQAKTTTQRWVHSLAAIHEELNKASLAHAVEAYVELGFPVFPLIPGQKIPFKGTNGKDDATTDKERVTRFWQKRPDANIGFALGIAASVLDVDTKRTVDGWVGARRLAKAGLLGGAFAQVATPSRGTSETGFPNGGHFYFAPRGGCSSISSAALDYKSTGGYVLLPPSRIDVGPVNEQGLYLWEAVNPDRYGPPLNWEETKRFLAPRRLTRMLAGVNRGQLEGLANAICKAESGTRHNTLVWAVCTAVTEGMNPDGLRASALQAGHTERQFDDAVKWALENAGGVR